MSNLLVVNPPFKFEGSLVELNNMFKPVEKFEVIYHSESLSRSTNYCFNLVGSICGYISARNHTDAMLERYAVIEEALRESLKQYKIQIDELVKSGKEKIKRGLEILVKEVQRVVEKLKQEYRVMREKIREKLKMEEIKEKMKKDLEKIYLQVRNVIKTVLDTFKDKYSDFKEYTRLNDEFLEMEKRYINSIKVKER